MSLYFQKVNLWKVMIWFTGALVALVLLLPVVYLLLRASEAGDAIWDILFSLRTARVLLKTVYLAASVTLGSALVAVPIAWLTVRLSKRYTLKVIQVYAPTSISSDEEIE